MDRSWFMTFKKLSIEKPTILLPDIDLVKT
jgi:hypothetical protein